MAGSEVPWIWSDVADCSTFEDVVLSCDVPDVQMCSCLSRCSCIIPALLYVIDCDVIVWQLCLNLRFH